MQHFIYNLHLPLLIDIIPKKHNITIVVMNICILKLTEREAFIHDKGDWVIILNRSGMAIMGYGVIESNGNKVRALDYGVVTTPSDMETLNVCCAYLSVED